jgi:L-proline amide hydrolase
MTTEATMEWEGLRTWYRVVGDLRRDPARLPVVICHGGPGLTHDYLTSVAELSRSGRGCVLYDQYGNGRSGHRSEGPPEFWTVDLFVRELQALAAHLGIADGYHVVGHSWGGMLALELALRHPRGLRSIVVSDAFASTGSYSAEVARLVADLPPDIQATIQRHEAAGTTDSPQYQRAVGFFYRRHVCTLTPVPDELQRTFAALGRDSTVYNAMVGPSEFHMTGTLRNWDVTGSLGSIDLPALLISGRHDEVTPRAVEELQRGLPSARWVLFEESSHMPHLEEPERFLDVVEEFLDGADARGAGPTAGTVAAPSEPGVNGN